MIRTQTEIEADLKKLQEQIDPLINRRGILEKELRECQIENCGVKIGEVVLAQAPGLGYAYFEAIVREIDVRWKTPWLVVSFKKKDGRWADRKNNAYQNWKKPDQVS